MERIDKILSNSNFGSRKQIQKLIKSGGVTIDGHVVTAPQTKTDPEKSHITVCGQALNYKKYLYIMMNKPPGVVCATVDRSCKTVIDLLPKELCRKGLFPAGRLDKDTQGLLIITDDGELAHNLLSPKNHVYKRYMATVDGIITEKTVKAFESGIIFNDGTQCLPARLKVIDEKSAYVEICEGKFHQIKKMFAVCGLKVTFLKRISIGSLELDSNLPIGASRELTKTEKCAISVVK